jgi:hypothetical protein
LTRLSVFVCLGPFGKIYQEYTGYLKKNGPRYNFATDNPNEKNYTGNEMALKTFQT